jgi:hypothetical protein
MMNPPCKLDITLPCDKQVIAMVVANQCAVLRLCNTGFMASVHYLRNGRPSCSEVRFLVL